VKVVNILPLENNGKVKIESILLLENNVNLQVYINN